MDVQCICQNFIGWKLLFNFSIAILYSANSTYPGMGNQNTDKAYDLGTYQRIVLEICNVLYFTARNGAIPLTQLYVYDIYHKKYGLDTMETDANNTSLPFGDDGPQYLIDKANEEASEFCLYLALAELLPSTIVTFLFGFVSDVTGKRNFLMWLPCLGNALYALCFALPLYINEADIDEPVTVALFGNWIYP